MLRYLIFLFLVTPVFSFAQSMEVGVFLGGSNYQGDLAPSTVELSFSETHTAAGLYIRPELFRFMAVRVGAYYGQISGDDANATSQGRRQRNLHFKSDILELSANLEWQMFGPIRFSSSLSAVPYIFGGGAIFHFNPKARYQGEWLALQPLSTEGQETSVFPTKKRYALTQFAIPLGAGIQFRMGSGLILGIQGGARKTFTDYLDDVSTVYVSREVLLAERSQIAADLANREGEFLQKEPVQRPTGTPRGDSEDDDWYLFGGITIGLDLSWFGQGAVRRGMPKCYSF